MVQGEVDRRMEDVWTDERTKECRSGRKRQFIYIYIYIDIYVDTFSSASFAKVASLAAISCRCKSCFLNLGGKWKEGRKEGRMEGREGSEGRKKEGRKEGVEWSGVK